MPCLLSCSATRALVASFGQVQKRTISPIARDFAVAALQLFGRNAQRAGQGVRIGQQIQRMAQVDDRHRLAQVELDFQFLRA